MAGGTEVKEVEEIKEVRIEPVGTVPSRTTPTCWLISRLVV